MHQDGIPQATQPMLEIILQTVLSFLKPGILGLSPVERNFKNYIRVLQDRSLAKHALKVLFKIFHTTVKDFKITDGNSNAFQ